MSSSSSADSAYLQSAKQKLVGVVEFDCLPSSVMDPLWDRVEALAKLTLGELGALKNARCKPAGKGRYGIIDICFLDIAVIIAL